MNLIVAGVLIAGIVLGTETGAGTPEKATLEAATLVANGDTDAAIVLLEQTVKRYPAHLPAYVALGRASLDKNPMRARVIAKEVLRIDPDSIEALDVLTRSFERARAAGVDLAGERRLRILEIGDYEVILAQRPDHGEVLYRIASQRLALERLLAPDKHTGRRKMLDAAVSELAHLREVLGDDAPAALRASAHFQSGRAIKHVGDFERSLGRDPAPSYAESVEQFQATLALAPERIDALGEIVLIYKATGRGGDAIAIVAGHVDKVETDRVRAKVFSMLGNLEIESGDLSNGVAHLEQAIASNPSLMDAYIGLYGAYGAEGRGDDAESAMRRAVSADPNFLMGYLLIGQIKTQQKRYDDAIAAYESVLRVAPVHATVLGMMPSKNIYRNRLYYDAASRLAWLTLRFKAQPQQALDMAERARTFAPAGPYLLDTIGSAYVALGEFARAKKVLVEALAENSEIASAHYHLAQAEQGLGEHDAARASVARALALEQPFYQREEARTFERQLSGG